MTEPLRESDPIGDESGAVETELSRDMSLADITFISIGTMIGVGVFDQGSRSARPVGLKASNRRNPNNTMSTDSTSIPPGSLSPSVATKLGELGDEEIHAVLDHVESLSNTRSEPAPGIGAGSNEKIISIEDHGTDTAVIECHDRTDGWNERPHRPHPHRVRSERQFTGEGELYWTYSGAVNERCTS